MLVFGYKFTSKQTCNSFERERKFWSKCYASKNPFSSLNHVTWYYVKVESGQVSATLNCIELVVVEQNFSI